jgi:molybdopterin synthase catalytic subunit
VKITVRLFAGLRELAGTGRRELELPEPASVDDVWPALELGSEPAGLLYAVNRVYAERETELSEGDEVALIPPVSGGAFRLTEGPVNLTSVVVAVVDERAGAIATFLGTVRAQSRGREVIALEYEAYAEMAEERMAVIAVEALERHGLCAAAVEHRVGDVQRSEPSVIVAVSARHRGEAFAGAREIIDRVKAEAPIWKKEIEGSEERWVSGSTPPQ